MSLIDNLSWRKKRIVLYILFFLIGSLYRLWLISDNNVLFWFDQARDATIVQEMIQEKDIKIQGPSASGTTDSVFHGVLYYYLIAPIYEIAGGNPQVVSGLLGIISMFTLIPIGELAWQISKSKYAFLITLFLFTFSTDSAQMGTWLSNPTIALFSIPAFFYYIYRVFWQGKSSKLWLVALFLGLSNQAIIFSVYLFGVLAIAWLINKQRDVHINFSTRTLISTGITYVITISSMILTQLLMISRGIFNPFSVFNQLNNIGINPYGTIVGVITSYSNIIGFSFFPTKPLLSILLFIGIIWFVSKQLPTNKLLFFLLFFFGPLILISWQYRDSYHTFIGITPILYVFTALFFVFIKDRVYLGKYIVLIILLLFTTTNIQKLMFSISSGQHPVAIQTGTTLKNKLELIDYTYSQASLEPFSISSFTSPYDYNTTWAYLYSWYGKNKYGYTPKFVGPTQVGIFGEKMLEEQEKPAPTHFVLQEPLGGIPIELLTSFTEKQNSFSTLENKQSFGSMIVEKRKAI